MKSDFSKNYNALLESILAIEKNEQEKYYSAVLSDSSSSTELMAEANARVKKLRDVLISLKDIRIGAMELLGECEASHVEEPRIEASFVEAFYTEVSNAEVPHGAATNEEIIVKTCEALILVKPFKFLSMDCEFVSISPADLKEPYAKLSNSMYVSTAGPVDEVCKNILSKCGIKEHEYNLYYEGV